MGICLGVRESVPPPFRHEEPAQTVPKLDHDHADACGQPDSAARWERDVAKCARRRSEYFSLMTMCVVLEKEKEEGKKKHERSNEYARLRS